MPAVRVRPPSSVATLVVGVCPAALLYATVRSDCACAATASAECCDPFTRPGGNPVTAVPGLTPRSPEIADGPVLVTCWPASTAKLAAVPSGTAVAALADPLNTTISTDVNSAIAPPSAAPTRPRLVCVECFMTCDPPAGFESLTCRKR